MHAGGGGEKNLLWRPASGLLFRVGSSAVGGDDDGPITGLSSSNNSLLIRFVAVVESSCVSIEGLAVHSTVHRKQNTADISGVTPTIGF